VALHIALDMLRASRREVFFQSEDLTRELEVAEAALQREQGTQPLDIVQQQHDLEHARRRVREALERINPRYAQAIRLRVLEERGREEAAAMMGVTAATFDVLLHRSMAALKKALGVDAPGRPGP
jgi:RNA polymerase sigma-70 factor (ECF subfamily)